jgi:hypothetical protein
MTATPSMHPDDPTAASLRAVGQLVCLYAELERAMGCLVELLMQSGTPPLSAAARARHRYQPPLRALRELLPARHADEPLKLRKFRRWRNRISRVQRRRNTMIHRAWIDGAGALRFCAASRRPDEPGVEAQGTLSGEQMAKDTRFLVLDLAAITAWIDAYRAQPASAATVARR